MNEYIEKNKTDNLKKSLFYRFMYKNTGSMSCASSSRVSASGRMSAVLQLLFDVRHCAYSPRTTLG